MSVKPLTWEQDEANWWVAQPARMSFGYEVRVTDAGNVRVCRGNADWAYFEGTADEAKAAFQTDFDSLILSFVDPSYASSQAEIERLKTALERQCDNMAFVVNHVTLHGWYDKFKDELEEDRAALSGGKP